MKATASCIYEFENLRLKTFYQDEQKTINRFINYNLEGHSSSQYDSLVNSEIENRESHQSLAT